MDYDLQLVEAGVSSGGSVITWTVPIPKAAEILPVYPDRRLVHKGSKR